MDYCYGKNPLNFGVDSTENGRTAAILHFCYKPNVTHVKQFLPDPKISGNVTHCWLLPRYALSWVSVF